MKLFKNTLYIIGAAAALASCNVLEQNSLSSFDAPSVYSDYTLSRYALNGVYEAYIVTRAYRSDYFMYYGANTDLEYWVSNGDDERSAICKYRVLPTNYYLNMNVNDTFYPALFNCIERANVCIHYLTEYGDVDNRPEMGELLGEALTLRALYYTDLLNMYGEVPARFEPVDHETLYVPKSDRDVIYKQLLKDLQRAATLMEFDSQTTTTRPGKACALGLYARLALQAAGYARRPDKGKVNTGDLGTIRKSDDPELQPSVTYPVALEGLKEIINSGKFQLFNNFEDLWHYYCNLKTSIDGDGAEVIYAMPFGDNRGHHIANNGVPDKKLAAEMSSGRKGIVPTFYFKYPSYDTRRDVTCCFVRWDSNGDVDQTNLKSEYCYFGKFRFDWMKDHPYNGAVKEAEDGAKFIYLRYADIYLMAAEIANELGDLDGAKEFMKPVLDRAWHNDTEVEVYLANLAGKEEFFQAVKDQRAFEFAGELLRKPDLIRWGCLKESIDQAIADMTDFRASTTADDGYRDAIYWRYKDNNDHYSAEVKFVKKNQDEPSGWNKKDKYISTFSQKTINNFYLEDPDQYMYRPIPAFIIIASLGSLTNDYGYNE